jgi:hypothetical protein
LHEKVRFSASLSPASIYTLSVIRIPCSITTRAPPSHDVCRCPLSWEPREGHAWERSWKTDPTVVSDATIGEPGSPRRLSLGSSHCQLDETYGQPVLATRDQLAGQNVGGSLCFNQDPLNLTICTGDDAVELADQFPIGLPDRRVFG